MTTNQKWILAIVSIAIVVIVLVYFNWEKVKAFFQGAPSNPISLPGEGKPCATQIGGGIDGTVTNGVCIKNQAPSTPPVTTPQNTVSKGYKLVIKNIAGAKLYSFSNGQFTQAMLHLPYMTEVISNAYVTSPQLYYQTANGWIDGNDVGIIQIL